MHIKVTQDTLVGRYFLTAVRRVERRPYYGSPQSANSREELREATRKAIQSLNERHGHEIGIRWAQVTPGEKK